MKVLVLGGTVFVGRAVVEAALARGHEVALFTRGRHGTELFPKAEKLRGDRDGDLAALRGRRFDAVVDTSGYVPRVVRASTELLAATRMIAAHSGRATFSVASGKSSGASMKKASPCQSVTECRMFSLHGSRTA